MALTQITYNDKSNYQSSSLANEYKVSASDMNEIKSVVNDVCTQVDNSIGYSTTETAIGTYTNGETLYRKVIDTGALPNASSTSIATGLNNVTIRKIYGIAVHTNGTAIPLPYVAISTTNMISIAYTSTNYISIDTSSTDRSGYYGKIYLEYTKN